MCACSNNFLILSASADPASDLCESCDFGSILSLTSSLAPPTAPPDKLPAVSLVEIPPTCPDCLPSAGTEFCWLPVELKSLTSTSPIVSEFAPLAFTTSGLFALLCSNERPRSKALMSGSCSRPCDKNDEPDWLLEVLKLPSRMSLARFIWSRSNCKIQIYLLYYLNPDATSIFVLKRLSAFNVCWIR